MSQSPYQPSPSQQPPAYPYMDQMGAPEGDATGGLIPYKNPCALIAYYLGLFSLFPVIGLLLAIPAFVLGILGLRARNRNPAVRGSVHAWIGIVMGFFMTLIWGFAVVGIVVALIGANARQ